MIYFLAPRDVLYCMERYISRNRDRVEGILQQTSYDQILDRGVLPPGSYIFAALDQITPTERRLIVRAWDLLAQQLPKASLLNDPRRVLLRHDLLQAAYESGTNKFRAFRASGFPRSVRFPAFVRCEWEHSGSLTPLLYSSSQIAIWLARLVAGGFRLSDLLIVEFLDIADQDGLFRRYSAYRIQDRIMPRAVIINHGWVTRDEGRLATDEAVREDYEYVDQNPHEAWLRTIFDRSGITYGRADYALVDGQPQLWEINTNPSVGAPLSPEREKHDPARSAFKTAGDLHRRRFYDALLAVNYSGPETEAVDLAVSDRERKLLIAERERMARVTAHQTWISQTVGPPIRLFRKLQSGLSATA